MNKKTDERRKADEKQKKYFSDSTPLEDLGEEEVIDLAGYQVKNGIRKRWIHFIHLIHKEYSV